MNLRLTLLLCAAFTGLLFLSLQGQNSKSEIQIRQCIQQLHDALIHKDSAMLEDLLRDGLVYGHSNAWTENKAELMRNNRTGFLRYETIFMDSLHVQIYDETAIARYQAFIRGKMNDKEFALPLHILQCWVREGKRWKLVARQGVRAPGP